jgi:hypothetical protein
MASLNLDDTHSRFAIVFANVEGVLVSFSLGRDGLAVVTSLRLSLRFQMSEDFMFIDEEVYDVQSGDLIHTIGQSPVCDGNTKQWLFNAGRYRIYSVSDSVTSRKMCFEKWKINIELRCGKHFFPTPKNHLKFVDLNVNLVFRQPLV